MAEAAAAVDFVRPILDEYIESARHHVLSSQALLHSPSFHFHDFFLRPASKEIPMKLTTNMESIKALDLRQTGA